MQLTYQTYVNSLKGDVAFKLGIKPELLEPECQLVFSPTGGMVIKIQIKTAATLANGNSIQDLVSSYERNLNELVSQLSTHKD